MQEQPEYPSDRDAAEERESLIRYYEHLSPAERRKRIVLQPAYRDAYNEITKAHQRVEQTRYFWERWVPVLGPTAAMVYMRLRDLPFSLPVDAAAVCEPSQKELARALGLSKPHTIGAALRLLERHGFIARQRISLRDPVTGHIVRTADRVTVYFEVPLHTEDAVDLLIRESHQAAIDYPRSAEKRQFGDPEVPKNGSTAQVVGRQPNCRKTASNVNGSKRNGKYRCLSTSVVNTPERRLAEDIAEELGDPQSLVFFILVASRMPELAIRRILSETKTTRLEGRLRGRPGAYFTAAVKREAREMGIEL